MTQAGRLAKVRQDSIRLAKLVALTLASLRPRLR